MKNKIIKNASWIIVCRIIQSVLGLIISMFTARYLGPSNFGLINYATSMVAFVTPIMHLGIRSVLVQELVKQPEKEGELLGTSIILNVSSACLCIVGVLSFVFIVNVNERDTLIVCTLYSVILIVQAFEVFQYWFQTKLLSKYTSVVSLCAYFIVSLYKVFLLITGKNVYWFAISNSIDFLIIAISLAILYKKLGGQKLSVNKKTAIHLLNYGKYYIISDLMINIFAQTDRVMLKSMIGNEATGFYSAAITCAALTQFVFGAILDSARPVIFESKQVSREKFENNMMKLYGVIIYLSLLQSIFISVFATFIVKIIYGTAYLPAADALRIVVWYTTFSYLGSARNIWILAENKQRYLGIINFLGATANIIMNLMFIPKWGIVGAAVASLITQIFTNIITGFIFAPIRRTNVLMLQSLNPKGILALIKSTIHSREGN